MKTATRFFALVIATLATTVLFSFARYAGGEGYEVFIGNRLVVQQFGQQTSLPVVSLDRAAQDQPVVVHYYHCGKPGKERVLTIRDEKNTLLKQWSYGNASRPDAGMLCPVDEIRSLMEKSNTALTLGYISSGLSSERKLIMLSQPALVRK